MYSAAWPGKRVTKLRRGIIVRIQIHDTSEYRSYNDFSVVFRVDFMSNLALQRR